MNQPEVHEIHKKWRSISDEFTRRGSAEDRILVGETWVLELDRMAQFYGTGEDELHLNFNFPFIYAHLNADSMGEIVDTVESLLPEAAWPAWTGSNHDVGRFPTRWAEGDQARRRCALLILMTLRGAPFLYFGDEIGMVNRPVDKDEIKDPVGITFWPDTRAATSAGRRCTGTTDHTPASRRALPGSRWVTTQRSTSRHNVTTRTRCSISRAV